MAIIRNPSLAAAAELRRVLSLLAQRYAAGRKLRHQLSRGGVPAVMFDCDEAAGVHGNFLPETYAAIKARPDWAARLAKVHTHKRDLPGREQGTWAELDSCNSSDALLMNVFCYPGVFENGRLNSLLNEEAREPRFGFKARVPFSDKGFDRTEVDMRLGGLLVEAKLTESDFQQKACAAVERYREFQRVFDRGRLPRTRTEYHGYQLIRNVLAAEEHGCSFCVLLDARRPDLKELWFQVIAAVKPVDLRLRCKVLTWQEAASALPPALQAFLLEKYGLQPA